MNVSLDNFRDAYTDDFAYSMDNRLMLNWYPRRILDLYNGERGSLLELGLGHGYTACVFSGEFSRHVVLDGSKEIIEQFKSRHQLAYTEIILSYFEDFDSDEQFDMIVMGFILEHVDNPAAILQRYKKYLKPQGSIFVAVPNYESLNRRYGYAAGLLPELCHLGPGDLALGHQRLFTADSLQDMIKQTGFRLKRLEGIFLKPLTTQQLINLNLPENILQAMMEVGIEYPELCVAMLAEMGLEE